MLCGLETGCPPEPLKLQIHEQNNRLLLKATKFGSNSIKIENPNEA